MGSGSDASMDQRHNDMMDAQRERAVRTEHERTRTRTWQCTLWVWLISFVVCVIAIVWVRQSSVFLSFHSSSTAHKEGDQHAMPINTIVDTMKQFAALQDLEQQLADSVTLGIYASSELQSIISSLEIESMRTFQNTGQDISQRPFPLKTRPKS
ncbi:hypothetical protein BC567DRAFT_239538 [Phyllosticta citribraziliensis]